MMLFRLALNLQTVLSCSFVTFPRHFLNDRQCLSHFIKTIRFTRMMYYSVSDISNVIESKVMYCIVYFGKKKRLARVL